MDLEISLPRSQEPRTGS